MVIIDKEYIAKVFVQALIERGFESSQIQVEETVTNVRTIKYMGTVAFSLIIEVSMVSETPPPTITVVTKTSSINMIALCERADELLQKKTKIFLN